MEKKLLFFISAATALFVGCSGDSDTNSPTGVGQLPPPVDPMGNPTQDSLGNPYVTDSNGIVVVDTSGNPIIDTSAIVIPLSSASAEQNPIQNPDSPASSGTTPVAPLSSSSIPLVLSSSSIKQINDNNEARETFLPAAGFYNNLTVGPLSSTKGGEIRCTFDGSLPNQGSELLNQQKQITQSSVVRCIDFVNGQGVDTTTQTYFIGENLSMPVVAISVDPVAMFDAENGYYDNDGWFPAGFPGSNTTTDNSGAGNTGDWNNTGNSGDWNNTGMGNTGNWGNTGFDIGNMGTGGFPGIGGGGFSFGGPCDQPYHNYCDEVVGPDFELPIHVEYFENGSSTKQKNWEIDGGLKISGQYSRKEKKKTVTITMRDEYQDGRLKYSLFKTRPENKKFKAIILRNNGNRFGHDYIEDAMLSSLLEGSGVDYQRSRQVVVFYNGFFFGIHDMREKLNRHFVETNYGIDAKSVNVIKIPKGGVSAIEASGEDGSKEEYLQLVNLIAQGNFAGENNASYNQIQSYLDVNNFARYIAAEIYYHNVDWPNNNVRAWGAPSQGMPFKYMVHDLDHGFGYQYAIDQNTSGNMFQWLKQGGGMTNGACSGEGCISQIYTKLIENPEFRRAFLNHSSVMLNYYLTYDNVVKQTNAITATIGNSEMERDMQMYGHTTLDRTGSNLINFANSRTQTVKQEYQQEFGLTGNEVSVTISSSGNGKVFMENMALPSTNYQGLFFEGNTMLLTAVPASGAVFAGWSDGSTENPRLVNITNGASFSASFK